MRQTLYSLGIGCVLISSLACSPDGSGSSSNPVAAPTANLVGVTGAVQDKLQICHWSPDWLADGDPYEYTVISISNNGSAPAAHLGHGDPVCDVSSALVGSDCSAACAPAAPSAPATPSVPSGTTTGNKNGVRLCHYNPDLEDGDPLWVVIEVSGNGNAPTAHQNHGDYDSGECNFAALAVGADCSACVVL